MTFKRRDNRIKTGRERKQKSLVDLLAMPEAAEIPFEPPRFGSDRLAGLEQELLAAAKGPRIELSTDEIRKKGLIVALRERAR